MDLLASDDTPEVRLGTEDSPRATTANDPAVHSEWSVRASTDPEVRLFVSSLEQM